MDEKKSNRRGLDGIHENVSEWFRDKHVEYPSGRPPKFWGQFGAAVGLVMLVAADRRIEAGAVRRFASTAASTVSASP